MSTSLAPALPPPVATPAHTYAADPLPPSVRVGHVHLRVADLWRSIVFYRDVLGFTLTIYGPAFGLQAAFLAAGDYHHHIALNTGTGADTPPAERTGLHHVAFLYPDRLALAHAVRRLARHGYPADSARDHGGSVSVYLRDPDGHGVELTYDRPREAWHDAHECNDPLDVRAVVDLLEKAA